MRTRNLTHEFVEYIPESLNRDTLYVSMVYATATHLCCCGCGEEIVTALSPTDWKLTFDGETISLHPSIGNWGLPCRSHYWIRRSRVEWSGDMSNAAIQAGRQRDRAKKGISEQLEEVGPRSNERTSSVWARVANYLRKLLGD